ncbi:hypothetical protein ABIE00_002377 [Arthrobacter sp. OAP107]
MLILVRGMSTIDDKDGLQETASPRAVVGSETEVLVELVQGVHGEDVVAISEGFSATVQHDKVPETQLVGPGLLSGKHGMPICT